MYSYVCEFNLRFTGAEAEEYLADAVRSWPRLWGEIPGVTGTLLLSNAFGLGGEFEYQWRLDIESLSTFSRIDEAVKSEDDAWRKIRREWFRARSGVRARVSRHLEGSDSYGLGRGGKDGAIHFVFQASPEVAFSGTDLLEPVRRVPGVVAVQALHPVFGPTTSGRQVWARLESLDSLDEVAALDLGAGNGQLFGEIREVDGSLFAGA